MPHTLDQLRSQLLQLLGVQCCSNLWINVLQQEFLLLLQWLLHQRRWLIQLLDNLLHHGFMLSLLLLLWHVRLCFPTKQVCWIDRSDILCEIGQFKLLISFQCEWHLWHK